MLTSFPARNLTWESLETEDNANLVMGIIGAIRNIRSEMMIHPAAEIEAHVICADAGKGALISSLSRTILAMTRSKTLIVEREGIRPKGTASHIYQEIEIFVPLAGLVDFAGEIAKLTKEQGKVEEQRNKTNAKLHNENFLANAPADVIAKEQEKDRMLTAKLDKLAEGIRRLQELAEAG
ncbi:MAG: hypothetical protein A2511_00695 [Deltaproteobacteria bacterium RIFOXYD12_FULL_50_9]|nr:MAG: hypothetical protein A2511_00695 [Deltaproteobacteria bacterium RIFOXYD12_FULL_50_9]